MQPIRIILSLILMQLTFQIATAQEKGQMVRLAKLVIDSAQLEDYKAFLKEEIETSLRVEPGVLTLYAVSEKHNPTHITILEIYKDVDAYQAHIQMPHFIKYKSGTLEMVKSLELVETIPLLPEVKVNQKPRQTQKKYQAKAPPTQHFGKEAFAASNTTTIRWLGMAGFLINSRGTMLMVDPVLGDFDMPVMIEYPIKPEAVPELDAVLITHRDNDHYSVPTCRKLAPVTREFHSTFFVDSLMKNEGFPSFGHNIGDAFKVEDLKIKLTPADHAWQNAYPERNEGRFWKDEDCAGFWIETPDGAIWATGDSRLMPEHLEMPTPDAILFDFSDSEWHFTLEGAVKLANTYPNTPLLLNHWGSVDAPDFAPFNGDPKTLYDKVVNPKRIYLLAPGEPFTLTRLKKSNKK